MCLGSGCCDALHSSVNPVIQGCRRRRCGLRGTRWHHQLQLAHRRRRSIARGLLDRWSGCPDSRGRGGGARSGRWFWRAKAAATGTAWPAAANPIATRPATGGSPRASSHAHKGAISKRRQSSCRQIRGALHKSALTICSTSFIDLLVGGLRFSSHGPPLYCLCTGPHCLV